MGLLAAYRSTIQDRYVIRRAVKQGISPERRANALAVDVGRS
jgi:hypothetical protein